jgi:hypothetical protein
MNKYEIGFKNGYVEELLELNLVGVLKFFDDSLMYDINDISYINECDFI